MLVRTKTRADNGLQTGVNRVRSHPEKNLTLLSKFGIILIESERVVVM